MTIYFSRVRLNPTRRGTRRFVTSPQSLHAAIMGSHAGAVETASGRVLWRLDQSSSHDIELYVVSPSPPDFTGLVEQAGWPMTETWDSTKYQPFLDRLGRGQHWRFRLTANPVRALAREGTRGHVSPHISVEHQLRWLADRASGWGFSFLEESTGNDSIAVSNRQTSAFDRRVAVDGGLRTRGRVAITRADFAGRLRVEDPESLRRALTFGMGRAKAYGCGLMTLAPL